MRTYHLQERVFIRSYSPKTNSFVEGVGMVIGRTFESEPKYDVDFNGETLRNVPGQNLSEV